MVVFAHSDCFVRETNLFHIALFLLIFMCWKPTTAEDGGVGVGRGVKENISFFWLYSVVILELGDLGNP